MSLPSFPDKDKIPSREEVINQIISSIAMEELGLSHIINAEGEKLQYALGTIQGVSGPEQPLTMEDLLDLNKSVHKTLDSALINQFLLKEKLLEALSASVMQGPPGPEGPQGPARISVDSTVIPLEPEDPPTVENVGPSDQDVVLQFGIPKGATGNTGPQGYSGESPYISPINGNWFIGTEDTGVHAQGERGLAATVEVEPNARVSFDDQPHVYNMGTEYDAVFRFEIPSGHDGITPHIDENSGNWFLGTEDTGVHAQGPKGDTGGTATVIPFSISKYGVQLSTDAQGEPLAVVFSGFGSSYYDAPTYLLEGEWATGTITIRENMNYGNAFIIPQDCVLKKIHILFSTGWGVEFSEDSIIRPFVCLAVSNSDNLVYNILENTITFTEPYTGTGNQLPRHTIRKGFLDNLDTEITEGSLVAIVAGLMAENVTNEQTGAFSISGGLYFE